MFQSLPERDFRFESEKFPGEGNVGHGMPDIPFSLLREDRPGICLEDISEFIEKLEEGETPVAGRVEHPSHSVQRRGAGQEIGPDHVFHEGEVSRLFPVSVNNRLLILKESIDEPRNDGGVFGFGVLPRTKDVEITESHCFQTIEAMKEPTVDFPDELAQGIG